MALAALGICLAGGGAAASEPDAAPPAWRTLISGVSYAAIEPEPAAAGSGMLHVVRIDPVAARLRALMASEHDGTVRTARRWCGDFGLAAAINMGMYQQDRRRNVGYARNGAHVNNPRWSPIYRSAMAFAPVRDGLPAATIADLDESGAREALDDYGTVVQNLRLIKAPGRNVWSKQDRRWSEAAIAIDADGRVLFLFSRTPATMWEFNRRLLSSPLGVVSALHAEGGPEASLSVHAGGVDLDLSGSLATGLDENSPNLGQWPVPNVLGVAAP